MGLVPLNAPTLPLHPLCLHTHAHSYAHIHTHSLSHTVLVLRLHTHTHTHTHSHPNTHTHTHTQAFVFRLCAPTNWTGRGYDEVFKKNYTKEMVEPYFNYLRDQEVKAKKMYVCIHLYTICMYIYKQT